MATRCGITVALVAIFFCVGCVDVAPPTIFQRGGRGGIRAPIGLGFRKIQAATYEQLANAVGTAAARGAGAVNGAVVAGLSIEIVAPFAFTDTIVIPVTAAGLRISSNGYIPITAVGHLPLAFHVLAPEVTFDGLTFLETATNGFAGFADFDLSGVSGTHNAGLGRFVVNGIHFESNLSGPGTFVSSANLGIVSARITNNVVVQNFSGLFVQDSGTYWFVNGNSVIGGNFLTTVGGGGRAIVTGNGCGGGIINTTVGQGHSVLQPNVDVSGASVFQGSDNATGGNT